MHRQTTEEIYGVLEVDEHVWNIHIRLRLSLALTLTRFGIRILSAWTHFQDLPTIKLLLLTLQLRFVFELRLQCRLWLWRWRISSGVWLCVRPNYISDLWHSLHGAISDIGTGGLTDLQWLPMCHINNSLQTTLINVNNWLHFVQH